MKYSIPNTKFTTKCFILIFFCCTLNSSTLPAAVITWIASGIGDWSEPLNWDLGRIPEAEDQVIIPANLGSVTYDRDFGEVQSLTIYRNNKFTVRQGSYLSINSFLGLDSYGLVVDLSTFRNYGVVDIRNSSYCGIENAGLIENYGRLLIDELPRLGIWNLGSFINYDEIHFHQVGEWDIYGSIGGITNGGTIRFRDGGTGQGIEVSSFRNTESGVLIFEGDHPGGISSVGGLASFYNEGIIEFEAETTVSTCINIESNFQYGFTNTATGEVRINGDHDLGIFIQQETHFTNEGSCTIFGVDGTGVNGTIGSAILNHGEVFNQPGGKIKILDCNYGIWSHETGSFSNEGDLTFRDMIESDIVNEGVFENQACGTIHGDAYIYQNGTDFNNFGWMFYLTDGDVHRFTSFPIINEGVVVDAYYRFDNVIKNRKLRVLPIVDPVPNVTNIDAWDIADASDLSIFDFTVNAGGGQVVGIFDLVRNGFRPNFHILNTGDKMYTKIFDEANGCTETIEVRIIEDSQASRVSPRAPSEFVVSPNPSMGLVNLQLPKYQDGDLDLRLVDINGRVVWQKEEASSSALSLDWTDRFPAGLYQIQIWQKGQLLDQQRLVLQRL